MLTLSSRSYAEWEHASLSEEYMVAELIKNRINLDPGKTFVPCPYRLQETLLCLYASLDQLIIDAPLTERERSTLSRYMRGYDAEEISLHDGITRQAVSKLLYTGVKKIVHQNDKNWLHHTEDRFRISRDCLPYICCP